MGRGTVQGMLVLSFIMTTTTVCAMMCSKDLVKKSPQNYIVLSVFTVFEGVMVGAFCAHFSLESIVMALLVTTFVVVGLTIFAYTTKTDFTGMGPYLVAAMLALCGVIFAMGIVCQFGVCP